MRRPVAFTDDDVRVNLRLAVFRRNVADERKHLDLFVYRNVNILLCIQIEVTERRPRKRAQRRKMCGVKPRLLSELFKPGNHFVARVKDDGVGFLSSFGQ